MKTKFFAIIISVMFFAISCEKDDVADSDVPEGFKELSELNMKLQSLRNMSTNGTYEFGAKAMNLNGFKKKGFKSDATDDDPAYWEDWETCAEINNYTDDEGFDVMVMDYGTEGCIEYGDLIKGKVTWKWKMDETGWAYEDIYEGYSAWGMTINGYYKGESKWSGSVNWDDFEDSTYFYNWFNEDYEEVSTNEEDMIITFEDGEETTYTSNFKSKFTFNSYTMLEGTFNYDSNTGDSYTWEIVKPVISNYDCMYWIPVSGIEEGTENENEFTINYGDGTCDNAYSITVNGVTEIIEIDEEDIWISDEDSTIY
jgi:hypothetical protein